MRKGSVALLGSCLILVLAAAPAKGATLLGFTESSNEACSVPGAIAQTQAPPGITYTAPSAGVITSWQHSARQIAGAVLKAKVFRPLSPLAGPASFLVVGESQFQDVSQVQDYSFTTRIPGVLAGDRLGLGLASNAGASPPSCNTTSDSPADEVYEGADFGPGSSGTFTPANTFRLNISAVLEPDNDRDGYGDETQDRCPTNAATQGACPPAPATTQKKKKCKKKKKKKGSASAAGKKCKKKKKKR